MFRRVLTRIPLRRFGTTANFPTKGKAQGGHPIDPQVDKKMFQTWLKDPSAYPIMFITCSILSIAGYKLAFVDTRSPSIYWSRDERGTIDFLENDRNPDNYEGWKKTVWKTGPHNTFAPFSYELSKEMGNSRPDAVQRLKMKKQKEAEL